MINKDYLEMLGHKSVIRELSELAAARGKEIGDENVFDFSLGNPSVPPPERFREVCGELLRELPPLALHGYSPSLGIPEVREQIAASLNRRFGMCYTKEHIFPTSGAAGAIAHALRAVSQPGDEVLVPAPFFPEYVPYVTGAGAKLRVIPPRLEDFQINFEALEGMITENTAAVLINTPNNPSGAVYPEEELRRLSALLVRKEKELGHPLFLISDEPYREIVFDGKTLPYTASFYDNTLTCYSFSKSLSAPGERIGYVAVNPACEMAELLVPMMGQISRGIGHNCPSSLMMRVMGQCCGETAELSVYETNMRLLYETLTRLGFEVTRPGGTFYMLPKAPEEDAAAFCRKALEYDLVFVPADGFGAPGYFRIAYCVETEKVMRALPVIERFVREQYPELSES